VKVRTIIDRNTEWLLYTFCPILCFQSNKEKGVPVPYLETFNSEIERLTAPWRKKSVRTCAASGCSTSRTEVRIIRQGMHAKTNPQ